MQFVVVSEDHERIVGPKARVYDQPPAKGVRKELDAGGGAGLLIMAPEVFLPV